MSNEVAFCIVNNRITGYVNGETVNIEQSHPNYSQIMEMLAEYAETESLDVEKFLSLTNIPKTVEKFCVGKVQVIDNTVCYNGKRIDAVLEAYILECMQNKLPFKPLLRFIDNCYQNPSKTARDRLFLWLQKREFPITNDGCFLGYKGVNDDYTDCHTGTYDNSVGKKLKMERNECDDNWGVQCSQGFHVGTFDYAVSFGARLMLVKVNPKDVVSVPLDTLSWKLRCCEYEVVGETTERKTDFYADGNEYQDEDEDYYDEYAEDYDEDEDE